MVAQQLLGNSSRDLHPNARDPSVYIPFRNRNPSRTAPLDAFPESPAATPERPNKSPATNSPTLPRPQIRMIMPFLRRRWQRRG